MIQQPTEVLSAVEAARISKEVLNIEVEKLEHYTKLFSKWFATQKNLPQNCSENFLQKFLIWSKLDFEKAKLRLEKFFYSRMAYKEFCCDRAMTSDKDLKPLQYIQGVLMPKLTPDGYRVNIVKILNSDYYDVLGFCRCALLAFDYKFHIDGVTSGEIAICDVEIFKPQHYSRIFNATSFKFIKLGVSSFPIQIKHIFIINCHPTIRKGFEIIKSFIPEKIAKRLVILENPRELQKYIPLECLPADYGGTAQKMELLQKSFTEYILENAQFYVNVGNMLPTGDIPQKYEETYSNEFGIDGSFRQLNID